MSKLFKGSKPDIPPPPPPPTTTDADAAAAEAAQTLARRKGRAASVLTGKSGAGTPSTAARTLLGS